MSIDARQLPGGLPGRDGLRRDFALRRPDGALELALAEIAEGAATMPEAVSRALLAGLECISGEAPTRAAVEALCVADRQYLMRALDAHLGHAGGWYQAECSHCAARFDFALDSAALPAKPAGPGFPEAELMLADGPLRLRVPTGADQARVLGEAPERRREALLRGLVVATRDGARLPEALAADEVARCEAALEAVAPQLACEALAACPECGQPERIALDPYELLARGTGSLLGEVHRLAWHYHWSEAEILALPRARRAHYLRLVDAARGMSH